MASGKPELVPIYDRRRVEKSLHRWIKTKRAIRSAAWQGFDFELIAFKNVHLIAQALGISGISVEPFIYYQDGKVQIDLLLARADRAITICEAKSYDGEYEPTEKDVACFRARKKAIQDLLKTKRRPEHFINYCFIVRNGIKRNRYFNEINPLVADISRVI